MSDDVTLAELFPWVEDLPSAERSAFSREMEQQLRSGARNDQHRRLAELIREWRATAQAHADGLHRNAQDLTRLPEPPRVPRP